MYELLTSSLLLYGLQIALNYLMCKGAIPIPGCTSVEHAEELLGAMGWSLEEDDIGVIDEKLTYHGF